jgi:hypothetical protein
MDPAAHVLDEYSDAMGTGGGREGGMGGGESEMLVDVAGGEGGAGVGLGGEGGEGVGGEGQSVNGEGGGRLREGRIAKKSKKKNRDISRESRFAGASISQKYRAAV